MIGVVDYEAGNITSVSNALSTIGAEYIVSGSQEELARCNGIVLPGVGAAPGAMASLQRQGLDAFLSHVEVPFLGICLGMQLLYRESEEGPTPCLGVMQTSVRKFSDQVSKVPHMGWNQVERTHAHPLLEGINSPEYFYFAHSYYAEVDEFSIAFTRENSPFAVAMARDNYLGIQFHPEKSGKAGLALLRNFEGICRSFRQ